MIFAEKLSISLTIVKEDGGFDLTSTMNIQEFIPILVFEQLERLTAQNNRMQMPTAMSANHRRFYFRFCNVKNSHVIAKMAHGS